MQRSLTRRRFVEGCAIAGGALACSGAAATTAFAEGGQIGVGARPKHSQAHTICQACPNGCGFTAYVVDGKLDKAIGDASSPRSGGTLCARGFGFTQSAYSSANLMNPLRRKGDGEFQTITWDEAFAEISQRLSDIMAGAGPEAIALVHDGLSPTASAYGSRFMAALGSGNAYVDDVIQNVVKEAAFSQVIGAPAYVPDTANANLVVLVGTSYADVVTPAFAASLQEARQAQTPIVAIDARLGTVASFANEWLAVNPGTELALLLCICNGLISSGHYDKEFVAANVSDFDQWAAAIADYRPDWAEGITGVAKSRIEGLIAQMIEAAPRVSIEYGNGSIGASAFANSSMTARAVCLLNTLLGTWNREGGALLPYDYSAASLQNALPLEGLAAEAPKIAGNGDFPLGRPFGASFAEALRLADSGALKALFAVDADIAYDYANMGDVERTLRDMDLFVCIAQQMTQTAQLADYVLPSSSYLASSSLPMFLQAAEPAVSIADAVIENGDTNAMAVADIISGLAQACNVGDAFDFSLDEAAAAQLESVGLTLEGLRENGSAAPIGAVNRISTWDTPTQKIQCASAACEEAGLEAMALWVEPLVSSNVQTIVSDDMNSGQENEVTIAFDGNAESLRFHLITGQQPVLGVHGYNVAELQDIAETYDLRSAWVNAAIAGMLGIATGDTLVVYNDTYTCKVKAFVTQRIVPSAVYLPSGFGHTADRQHEAKGEGVNPLLFCDPAVEKGYGTLCTQEALVCLLKEGE